MAEFFTRSRTEFWLVQMQSQRMVEQLGNDSLPPLLRQEIATFVSRLNQCVYCSASHSADIDVLGGDAVAIEQAVSSLDSAPVDDKRRDGAMTNSNPQSM
jgi:AhpD family alkylhydroperoxidase